VGHHERVGVGDHPDVGQSDLSPTGTAVSTAKDAWNALKDIFEARDNARLLQLMHERSKLKKDGDENIIKYTSRAKGRRQELAML